MTPKVAAGVAAVVAAGDAEELTEMVEGAEVAMLMGAVTVVETAATNRGTSEWQILAECVTVRQL